MKTIKGEKIGRSFGGDIYRGSDGNTYWKGDRNGYVEETLETQRKKHGRRTTRRAMRFKTPGLIPITTDRRERGAAGSLRWAAAC